MLILRVLIAFILAVLVTYILASAASTQTVANQLLAMNVEIDLATRLKMTWHDILGMYGIFLPVLTVGFAIALPVSALITRLIKYPAFIYALGGFTALIAIHLILKAVFGMAPVMAGRDLPGLLLQGFAGAVGGYVFFLLKNTNASLNRAQNPESI